MAYSNGVPDQYLLIDPNDPTKFSVDSNAVGPMFRLTANSNYPFGYQNTIVDTTQIGTAGGGSGVHPDATQSSMLKLVKTNGAAISAPTSDTAPVWTKQEFAPSVGGYYDPALVTAQTPQAGSEPSF